MHQKWPDKTFAMVPFVFSHNAHFGLEGGGPGGGVPLLLLWCTAILILPGVGGEGATKGLTGCKGQEEAGGSCKCLTVPWAYRMLRRLQTGCWDPQTHPLHRLLQERVEDKVSGSMGTLHNRP